MASQLTSGLLRHADFRKYLIGRSASAFGSGIAALALTFGMLDLGASPAVLGLVLAASTIPQIALTLLGGVLGDRLQRRRLLIGTDVVQAGAQLCIGLLLLRGDVPLWAIVALRLVYGGAAAFHRPAANGIIVDVVGGESMQEARSLLTMATSGARLLAPAAGGILVAVFNPGWALVMDAVTYLVSALALFGIHAALPPVSLRTSLRTDFAEGWHEFTSRRWAVKMIAAFMLYQATALPAVFVLGPIHADTAWAGAGSWAWVLGGMAVGDVLGGLLTLRWRPRRLLLASNLVWALDLPLILVVGLQLGAVTAAVPAAVLFGMAMTVGSTLWYQALATHVPPTSLARVTSYDEVGSIALNPLGYLVIGAVASGLGVAMTFAMVILSHVLAILWLVTSRDITSIERTPVAPTTK